MTGFATVIFWKQLKTQEFLHQIELLTIFGSCELEFVAVSVPQPGPSGMQITG